MAVEQSPLQMNLKQGFQEAQPGCSEESLKTTTMEPVNDTRRGLICELSPPPPSPSVEKNYFKRLPPEIIIKVFSYLDAASLFSVGFVNRQFYRLANDRTIWYNLYAYELANKKWRSWLTGMEGRRITEEQDLPAQVWKTLLFREMGWNKDLSWKKELKELNLYTAMPQQTEEVLRRLRVRWEISLILTNGLQHKYQQSQAFFSDSSVTVCWNSAVWPQLRQVLSLHLHGVIYPPKTSSSNKPPWRSLIDKLEVKAAEKWMYYGSDQLVRLLKFGEGVTVGVWRGCWKIAFIVATLHFHQLVERSVLGTVFCPYRPAEIRSLSDDVTEDYYLRGYSLLVLLHNAVRTVMQCHYSDVLIKRDVVQREYVYFRPANVSIMTPWPDRCPFSNQISFPWKALDLQGDIKNCCMMTLSVLDEKKVPLWCVSSPVALFPHTPMIDSEMGKHYMIRYVDEVGKVRVVLQCLENPQVYFMEQLQIWIRLARVNAHLKTSSKDLQ